MRPVLSPGCFGSVLAAHAASPTCGQCPYQTECFEVAVKAEAEVMERLKRKLEARHDAEEADTVVRRVVRYLLQRKRTPEATPDRALKRTDALTRRFEENHIDVTKIKEGVNPFDQAAQPVFYAATQFILEGTPFKPKDVSQELKQLVGCTPKSLASDVSRFLTALVNANVLERKERNILCLSQ